jgi:hypothetical protein
VTLDEGREWASAARIRSLDDHTHAGTRCRLDSRLHGFGRGGEAEAVERRIDEREDLRLRRHRRADGPWQGHVPGRVERRDQVQAQGGRGSCAARARQRFRWRRDDQAQFERQGKATYTDPNVGAFKIKIKVSNGKSSGTITPTGLCSGKVTFSAKRK